MEDNRGITLLELIVVMVILAVLSVGSITGYRMINAGSAKHAAEQTGAVLNYVQLENKTKIRSYLMEITKDQSSGKYILSAVSIDKDGSRIVEETHTLKLKSGKVSFWYNGDTEQHVVDGSELLEVGFRKDTGGVKQNPAGLTISRIGFTSPGTTLYIRLVTATGKHFIEE